MPRNRPLRPGESPAPALPGATAGTGPRHHHNPGGHKPNQPKLPKVPGAPAPPPEQSGLGTNMFNDSIQAVNAGMGLLAQNGVGGPMLPGTGNQAGPNPNQWLTRQMEGLYNEFEGARRSNPALAQLTWTQFLSNRFGQAGPPTSGGGLNITTGPLTFKPPLVPGQGNVGAGLAANMRSLYSRAPMSERLGYPAPDIIGPGRTVTQ